MESGTKRKRLKIRISNNAKIGGNEGDGAINLKIKKRFTSSRNASWIIEGSFSAEGNWQINLIQKYYLNWSNIMIAPVFK